MTRDDFINIESLKFETGNIVVVSGPDLAEIYLMLIEARDAIILSGTGCLDPIDTRATKQYPSDIHPRSFQYEYETIANQDIGVILVGNQFDRLDTRQNRHPLNIDIDVVRDLLNISNVDSIPNIADERYGSVRGLFPYMSWVYYYDTRVGEVHFIKTQIPERP